MFNPVLKSRKHLLYYSLIWVVIIFFHVGIFKFFYHWDWEYSIIDALIFNGLFSLIGLGLWNAVRYISIEGNNVFNILVNHFFTALFSILLWLVLSFFLESEFIEEASEFSDFLKESLPWRLVSGIFFYLLIILVYYLVIYYNNFREKMLREAELKGLIRETELNMLKSQINPHFLFNSLNSISSLTLVKPEKAREMIIKLSDYLRYALAHKENEKVTLKEEMENVRLYLNIEKVRFGKKLMYREEMEEKALLAKVPNMILQPLFENAVKHGVYESTDAVLVFCFGRMQNQSLEVTITNDYSPSVSSRKGEEVGLKNIYHRMALVYGRNDLVSIRKTEDKFTIGLLFPQL